MLFKKFSVPATPGRLAITPVLATPALAFCLGLFALDTHAARPMVTDDAGVAERGTCELETWIERPRDSTTLWLLPTCGIGDDLELTLGGSLAREESSNDFGEVELSAKFVLHDRGPDTWALGLAAGVIHDTLADRARQEYFAYLPASRSFADQRLTLHANLGWLRERETRDDRLTWALGAETPVTESTRLFAETFGEDGDRPFYQLGLAHWLVADRLQVDFSYGDRLQGGSAERVFTLGLVLVSDPFFQ